MTRRREDEKRQRDRAARPESIPGKQPPIRQHDGDIQVLELSGQDEFGLPDLDGDRRHQEGEGDSRAQQEESPAFGRLFFPAPAGDRRQAYPPTTPANIKMGGYIAMTSPPMTTPRKIMSIGSTREVNAPTAESTSSS